MKYVIVERESPTMLGETLSLFYYAQIMQVITETENTVTLQSPIDNELYTFNKEYIIHTL